MDGERIQQAQEMEARLIKLDEVFQDQDIWLEKINTDIPEPINF